jgi:hypothetical protein
MKIFPEKILQNEKFYILPIALVAVAVILPVLIYGLPYGYDLPHHYQCAMTYYESILAGDFYPSWSLNRNFGFGGMETRLYPPISHYALAVFYLIIGDWQIATFLTLAFFTFVGGCGVYLWAREYMPAGQAVFAGCIYNLLPYHLTQIYNTFFYAEFIGSCVLPFTFLFISRVCRRGKMSDVIGLSVSFAVLILTHLPLTVIGAICFTVYGLSLLKREKIISQISKLAAGSFLGLAASSFFWIKVVQEKDWMAKTQIYPDPWLDYRLHFLLTPIQTFEGDLRETIFNLSLLYYDLMLLCAVVLALFCTIPFLIGRLKTFGFMKGVWLIFALSVFLAVPFSRFVWDHFPLLQEVQFPWRWLAIVSLAASVLSAGFLNRLVEWFKNNKRPFALIICGAILAVVTFSVKQIMLQSPFIERERISSVMQENADKKGFTFWWTIWTKKEAFENKEKVSAGNRNIEIANWTATEKEFQISAGEPTEIRIALFYHPNWQATVNGIQTETKPDENGALLFSIPPENSDVKIIFQETAAVQTGRWLSAAFWLCLIIFGSIKSVILFHSFQKKSQPSI